MRILLVEDDAATRDATSQLLQLGGDDTRAVATGAEALAVARAFRPDALICDWVLRGDTDARTVILTLAAANPALRVLVLTGMPVDSLESELRGLPIECILAKPFRPTALDSILRNPPPAHDSMDGGS